MPTNQHVHQQRLTSLQHQSPDHYIPVASDNPNGDVWLRNSGTGAYTQPPDGNSYTTWDGTAFGNLFFAQMTVFFQADAQGSTGSGSTSFYGFCITWPWGFQGFVLGAEAYYNLAAASRVTCWAHGASVFQPFGAGVNPTSVDGVGFSLADGTRIGPANPTSAWNGATLVANIWGEWYPEEDNFPDSLNPAMSTVRGLIVET